MEVPKTVQNEIIVIILGGKQQTCVHIDHMTLIIDTDIIHTRF